MPAKKRGTRRVAPESAAKRMTAKKKLEELDAELIKLFRSHWRSINAKMGRGVDVAQQRAEMFFASNFRERLRMARRYYAPARAARLSIASDEEILRLSEPWLSAAREELEFGDSVQELRKLVAAEYVALVWNSDGLDGPPMEPAKLVAPLPDESVYYGDVFEITAGPGVVLRVCKSVAEPFLKSERREATAAIEQEFLENARQSGFEDDYWRLDSSGINDPRAVDMEINEKLPGEDELMVSEHVQPRARSNPAKKRSRRTQAPQ